MMQTKFDELKGELSVLATKTAAQHRLAQSSLVLLKNIDARIEGIKDLLTAANVFTEDQYQDAVDSKLGLRRKADHETIELSDVCWVSYEAEIEGVKDIQKEGGLPIRVGSNAVMFESALIGKGVNEKGIVYEGTWKEQNPADLSKSIERKIKFTIDVNRVKTRSLNGTGNGISDDIDRADGNGGENSDIAMFESGTDSEGLGLTDGDNDQAQHSEQ